MSIGLALVLALLGVTLVKAEFHWFYMQSFNKELNKFKSISDYELHEEPLYHTEKERVEQDIMRSSYKFMLLIPVFKFEHKTYQFTWLIRLLSVIQVLIIISFFFMDELIKLI